MNITQKNSSFDHPQILSKYVFWPLALIPAICVVVSYLYFDFPISLYSILSELFVILLLIKVVIVPLLAVFFVNLIVPCATNRVKSFLFLVPTFIVHVYFFSFPLFWMAIMNIISPGDTPGAYTGYLVLGAFSIPLEVLLLGMTMTSAWLGAWITESRKKIATQRTMHRTGLRP